MFMKLLLALTLAFSGCAKKNDVSQASDADQVKQTEKAETQKAAKEKMEEAKASEPATVGPITVVQAEACRSVENRTPVATADQFPSDVGKLYLYTNVQLEPGSETSIQHVWYHGNKEMAKVKLPVKGPRWRTYSSKVIDSSWTGDWRVEIKTNEDQLIKSVSFNVK